MTLAELTAKMKEGASKKSAFGNTVKFATDQGVVYIDGNQNPPVVRFSRVPSSLYATPRRKSASSFKYIRTSSP